MRPWQWLVPITTLATITMNGLANALPIAGRDTGAISDAFPVLITPAGYVFSIWGLIYLGLAGYAVWQALPAQAAHPRVRALALPVTVGNLANLTWILLWHHLWIGTSVLVMLVLLASLIVTYLRLRPAPGTATDRGGLGRAERVLARGTFSVYLGWITIATVANVTIALYDAGWRDGFLFLPAQAWGVVTLLVATALGARMLLRYRDLPYAAVLVWAFVGIVVAQSAWVFVAGTAVVGALVLLYLAALRLRSPRRAAAA
jgi:translocator protein